MVKCCAMQNEEKRITYRAQIIGSAESDLALPQFLGIEHGIIRSLSSCLPNDPEQELVDLGQLVIAPLFCDHHLHFSGNSALKADEAGRRLLCHGIGRVFEGGDKAGAGLTVRDALRGRLQIRAAGYALFRKGGYGTAIGQGVVDAEDALRWIDELQSLSVDYIKIIHSGMYEPESDLITAGGFGAEELRRIVDHARKRGLDVYCHVNGDKEVKEAVDAGVTAVIHGLRVSDATLSAMAANNVAFIPTVHAFHGLHAIARTDTARQNIARSVGLHLSAINKAYELGVRILPGSDAGPRFLPYGSSYLAELGLLEKAGMPYADVIRAASMTDLQVNASADFLVLDGLSVNRVVLAGQVVC